MEDRCPYLGEGGDGLLCAASMTKMTPSLFEQSIYCSTGEHFRCPLLIARTLRDGDREWADRAGVLLTR